MKNKILFTNIIRYNFLGQIFLYQGLRSKYFYNYYKILNFKIK